MRKKKKKNKRERKGKRKDISIFSFHSISPKENIDLFFSSCQTVKILCGDKKSKISLIRKKLLEHTVVSLIK